MATITAHWMVSSGMLCGLACGALAQGVPGIPTPTHDWGCEVLLCLANPNGPEAVAPCVPPIERLWSELGRGHAFPTCAMTQGPGGRSYAKVSVGGYDPCPAGTAALPAGAVAALAAPIPVTSLPRAPSGALTSHAAGSIGALYSGIGDGDGYAAWTPDGGPPPPKVCVAGPLGTRPVPVESGYASVNVYETLVVAPARGFGPVIDVYIDDRWWQSVRW